MVFENVWEPWSKHRPVTRKFFALWRNLDIV